MDLADIAPWWMMDDERLVDCQMGVSTNRGIPKWMVKILENPIKMDDLGVPLIFGNTQIGRFCFTHKQQATAMFEQ